MSTYGIMTPSARPNGSGGRPLCDLRSDTVTQPDAAMRRAMAEAEVGDDVYGDDPSVNRLEAEMAARLGKAAAIFFPTGTQSNLAAVLAHCGRGDEIIVGDRYHIYCNEGSGASVLGGVSLFSVPTDAEHALSADAVRGAVKADDPHYARSRLLCVENTVGGRTIPLDSMRAATGAARDSGLAVHLDGARFFNATTALNCAPDDLAGVADTISVCLSKGLGAPVGSVLVGDQDTLAGARRNRKLLGGSMRQSGMLAAAGLHALEHNIDGLAQDHARAVALSDALSALHVGEVTCHTNMVFFKPEQTDLAALRAEMAARDVLIGGQSPTIRLVLHRDIDDTGLTHVITAFTEVFEAGASGVGRLQRA